MMTSEKPIYLDWNATTPILRAAAEAMAVAWESSWGNPASIHSFGRKARCAVESARETAAALVGYHPRDVVLTSGGTEANNLAIMHAFTGDPSDGALVVSRIEHPSVVRAAERIAARGFVVEWVEPEESGVISVASVTDAFSRALARAKKVCLTSVQVVNHETGVIHPIGDIAEFVHEKGSVLHVDAVQAIGKLPRTAWAGADLVSVAAHKLRGPKGIGALLTRPNVKLTPVLVGGSQERGLRPGTQDPAAAAGFAVAADHARTGASRYAEIECRRDAFEAALIALALRNGQTAARNGTANRVPHVCNLSWSRFRGDELVVALDLEGVAVSSGSACSAGTAEPSPVLAAMVGKERALGAVRVSLGDETTDDDLRAALLRWERVLARSVETEIGKGGPQVAK